MAIYPPASWRSMRRAKTFISLVCLFIAFTLGHRNAFAIGGECGR